MKANKIESILTFITLSVLLTTLVLIPIDITNFFADRATYAKVYDLNTSQDGWEWDYLKRWLYIFLLIAIGITIITLRIIKRNNEIIRKINYAFLLLFFASVIIGFYDWMRTGFDH